MKGKLIVIEGTDCSGKETQSNLLLERLKKANIKCAKFSFPNYDSSTGRIIAGPYLGKPHVCDSWFNEGAVNVDPKVASLYYAADRKYNIDIINELINNGTTVILDRYIYSNMAHQGSKIENKEERYNMYNWLEKLEFELLELPKVDIKVFLHMPIEASSILKKNRTEKLDQHEIDKNYLIASENAYKEISNIYNFKLIECSYNNIPRKIEEINDDLFNYVIKYFN